MAWFGWLRRNRSKGGDATVSASPTAVIAGRERALGIPYALPKDLEEMNRLDFQHYLIRQALGGNYAAPLQQPRDILDVGTGTGLWAREMAQLFPSANVVGLDVKEPPRDEDAAAGRAPDMRPMNYSFVPGNVLEGLPFANSSFDFTHMRLLVTALPHDRWPFVVNELVRVTRPNGWVESVEATTLEGGGPALDQLMRWTVTMLRGRGVEFADGAQVGALLRSAGLVNVEVRSLTLPFGAYGGRIGNMLTADYFNGVKGFGGIFAAQGIASLEEFEAVRQQARADVDSPRYRCVSPFYIAYGQRVI